MPDPIQSGHHRLAPAFNFRVTLRKSAGGRGAGAPPDLLGDGGFQECSGLEIEMDAQELQEGGRNNGVVRLVGSGKYAPLVLKRGMFHPPQGKVNAELWRWMQSVLGSTRPTARYDGTVEVLDRPGERTGRVLATWSFARALPQKIRGPELNAKTGEIAIEELVLVHEGLRLEA